MATIKVKLRPSSVVGRAGTVYYQVTHRRATQQVTTNIRLQPDEWDAIGEQVVVSVADESGLDINAPGAMEKTYGLSYLLGGVYDAYAYDGQYGSITINIK